jgi:hypothetical protein
LLTFPQIVEAESVFDYFVREIHLSALLIFDDAVTLVVVVGHEPCIGQISLL